MGRSGLLVSPILADAVTEAGTSYYRLVLLVGPHGSGKTRVLRAASAENGWPVIQLGADIARSLVELPPARRSFAASEAVATLVTGQTAKTVAVDNVEILFDPSLRLQPLDLLKQLSRSTTLIVAWPGTSDGTVLTYAEPGRPEYSTLDTTGVTVLPVEPIAYL